MAVSKRLRFEIFRRDSHTCRYCGATPPDVPLRIDHVTPVALGGGDTPDNLVTSCEPCNSGKSSASPDAHHVANVSDDAVRWAEAMKQAAGEAEAEEGPKLAYRQAFVDAWNEWTYESMGNRKNFDLPDDWRSSVERYRVAGIPASSWGDLIEPGMVNRSVKGPDVFRYTCGVANNRLKQMVERAAIIAGGRPTVADHNGDAVLQAAIEVWLDSFDDEANGAAGGEARASLINSVHAARQRGLYPGQILEGAQNAAWSGESDVVSALTDCVKENALHQWTTAWVEKTGHWPDEDRVAWVVERIGKLADADVSANRINRAAIYAGSRRSILLHFGLDADELELIGVSSYLAQAGETWAQAFFATAGRWPTGDERSAFLKVLWRIGDDGDIWIPDVYAAAASAGAYQDPDISTCLTRRMSVFEIAARPLAPAA